MIWHLLNNSIESSVFEIKTENGEFFSEQELYQPVYFSPWTHLSEIQIE